VSWPRLRFGSLINSIPPSARPLPLSTTTNLAEVLRLINPPDVNAPAHDIDINAPDFLPLHFVRTLAQAATLVCVQGGKLVVTPLGNQCRVMSGNVAY
jgi:hypothetical protein